MRSALPPFFAIALVLSLTAAPASAQEEWRAYEDPQLGYRIDLPVAEFAVDAEASTPGRMVLHERDGDGRLTVYSGESGGAAIGEIVSAIAAAEWIDEVTYRAGGDSWAVLSGYYRPQEGESEKMIFYLKLMFDADRSRYSAFEIGYPISRKREYDELVTRLEKSLRPPRG